MAKLLGAMFIVIILFFAIGFYFKLPLILLLFFGSLLACVISFILFGLLGKDTQKKQQELLKKDK